MALHNGIDTVAIASRGVYSETYGDGDEGNIANLYASFGLLEDFPSASSNSSISFMQAFNVFLFID